ncbi:nuclear transport factor 2 family protein [Actinomadura barringtoniae]|uniref:Nuclear transport factor 2 family protein n=1 Tax=Actinomadura barringtoniae TaxID=1427535 RepID=A0A939T9V8_9ACTN|nr:nuclear transport factor 2 family protein [Actinomadura barringtoniae]MBO2451807.1 nuclear transport factor 2 family protein [Actinomadura barringtoniae]
MPTQDHMKAALQAYIDGFAAGDAAAVSALFADDAEIEDPVGHAPVQGRAAIDEFYKNAIDIGTKLLLDGPIRGSHGARAAMAFTVDVPAMNMRIRAIDVMTFNDDGEIIKMEAFWGPDDIES